MSCTQSAPTEGWRKGAEHAFSYEGSLDVLAQSIAEGPARPNKTEKKEDEAKQSKEARERETSQPELSVIRSRSLAAWLQSVSAPVRIPKQSTESRAPLLTGTTSGSGDRAATPSLGKQAHRQLPSLGRLPAKPSGPQLCADALQESSLLLTIYMVALN